MAGATSSRRRELLACLALLSVALTHGFHGNGTCGNSLGLPPGQVTTVTASQTASSCACSRRGQDAEWGQPSCPSLSPLGPPHTTGRDVRVHGGPWMGTRTQEQAGPCDSLAVPTEAGLCPLWAPPVLGSCRALLLPWEQRLAWCGGTTRAGAGLSPTPAALPPAVRGWTLALGPSLWPQVMGRSGFSATLLASSSGAPASPQRRLIAVLTQLCVLVEGVTLQPPSLPHPWALLLPTSPQFLAPNSSEGTAG